MRIERDDWVCVGLRCRVGGQALKEECAAGAAGVAALVNPWTIAILAQWHATDGDGV